MANSLLHKHIQLLNPLNAVKPLLLSVSIMALAACGGSSGGGSDTSVQTPPTNIEATPVIPVVQEPVTDTPIADEPIQEDPVVQEPAPEESVTGEPTTEEPTTEDPVAIDADEDSISDSDDECPNTATDELINSVGCSDAQLDNDLDGITNDFDRCDTTPADETVGSRGCGLISEVDFEKKAFVENDGLLVIEIENTDHPDLWQLKRGTNASGNAYLEWEGENLFRDPGTAIVNIPIIITHPGNYRFVWRNALREGDRQTESNDSWLKINADVFYGQKTIEDTATELGHIVCPKGAPSSNMCVGDEPVGSGENGWLKAYRTGGGVEPDEWNWLVWTSDFDAHAIFARFDRAGEYTISIAARSKHHAIDRITLFRSGNEDNNIELGAATGLSQPESERQ